MTQCRQSFQSEDLGVSDTANVNECHQPGPRERLCGLGAWERLAPHTVPADASRGPSQISLCRQRLRWSSSPTHGRQDPQGHPAFLWTLTEGLVFMSADVSGQHFPVSPLRGRSSSSMGHCAAGLWWGHQQAPCWGVWLHNRLYAGSACIQSD